MDAHLKLCNTFVSPLDKCDKLPDIIKVITACCTPQLAVFLLHAPPHLQGLGYSMMFNYHPRHLQGLGYSMMFNYIHGT
jgi:hypothetical protein